MPYTRSRDSLAHEARSGQGPTASSNIIKASSAEAAPDSNTHTQKSAQAPIYKVVLDSFVQSISGAGEQIEELVDQDETRCSSESSNRCQVSEQNRAKILLAVHSLHAVRASSLTLVLAFLIPYIIDESLHRESRVWQGLFQSLLSSSDWISISYILYILASISSPIAAGSFLHHRPRRRLVTILAILGTVLKAHAALLVYLYVMAPSTPPSLPLISLLCITILVSSSLLPIPISSYIPELGDSSTVSTAIIAELLAKDSGRGGIVNASMALFLGLIVIVPSTYERVEYMQLLQRASVATLLLSTLLACFSVVMLYGLQPIKQVKFSTTDLVESDTSAAASSTTPLLLLRRSQMARRFLASSACYQASIRSLCYLAPLLLLQHPSFKAIHLPRFILLTLITTFLGSFLTYLLPRPPSKQPLLTAVAFLVLVIGLSPKTYQELQRHRSSVYLYAILWGIFIGITTSYGPAVWSHLLLAPPLDPRPSAQQPQAPAIGIHTKAWISTYSLYMASGPIVEWTSPLLYAILHSYSHAGTSWTVYCALFPLLVSIPLLVIFRLPAPTPPATLMIPAAHPHQPYPLVRRLTHLLRSLPSHLSTIVESPSEGGRHLSRSRMSSLGSPQGESSEELRA